MPDREASGQKASPLGTAGCGGGTGVAGEAGGALSRRKGGSDSCRDGLSPGLVGAVGILSIIPNEERKRPGALG